MTRFLLVPFLMMATAAEAQTRELRQLVRESRAQVGQAIGPGATIEEISLNGNTFLYKLVFDAAAGANTEAGYVSNFADFMVAGLCQQPPVAGFVAGGGQAYFLIEDPAGTQLTGREITSC